MSRDSRTGTPAGADVEVVDSRRTVAGMGTREHWDAVADVWEQRSRARSDEVDPYAIVAMDGIPLDDYTSILDIGCGPGVTTVELAERAGPNSRVIGVDISGDMLRHARDRAKRAWERGELTPDNIELRVADAEHDDLGRDHDMVFSRFGIMFFDDPAAAFANLAGSLRTDGWLSIVAWAKREHNPWMTTPPEAAASTFDVVLDPPPASGEPGPFSLADVAATTALLEGAGFDRIDVIDITQPRHIRHGSEHEWISLALRTGPLADAYGSADDATREAAVEAVLGAIEKYRESGPAGDWLIPAHARAFIARRA